MEENRTLLIVDDEPETLKGYVDFLSPKDKPVTRRSSRMLYGTGVPETSSPEQYVLLLAQSGEEAIKLFEKELKQGKRVAAGFFDVKLGTGMDGLATIHAIKTLDPDIHCVVVTAYHDRSVEEINQLFGDAFKDQWDYLNKPFTPGEIVQKARQMVAAWNRKRKLEELTSQLIRSERLAAVGQVARGVGHEFGNILLRMLGKTDLALAEKDPAKIHEHLKGLMKAVERAGVIVRNLQSFSKTEPHPKWGPIVAPLEESISLFSHELNQASIQVHKDIQEVPALYIDQGAIAQVFLNLMINAKQAMPKGGILSLGIRQTPSPAGELGVEISIADSGTGISAEVLPKIFDFAFSTKGEQGSGIGLAISKDIVESHGGRILVETQEGKGSKFSVWLPLGKPELPGSQT